MNIYGAFLSHRLKNFEQWDFTIQGKNEIKI